MSDAVRFLKWLEDAGKHWDTVRPEDVMRELGRTDERDERIRELEAKVTNLRKQLEYGDVTPASAVAAEVAVLRENNEALGLKVNELEAQCAAMREALECIRNHHTYEDWRVAQDMADAALASDAGKAVLERLKRAEADAYEKVQALAAVSTLLTSSQPVPEEWDRYGAVQDARRVQERLAKVLEEKT